MEEPAKKAARFLLLLRHGRSGSLLLPLRRRVLILGRGLKLVGH